MTHNVGGPGRPKNPPKPKKLLKEIMPVADIFEDDELGLYYSLIDIYLSDFDEEDLSSADIDDIMTIATNKILEVRLLKSSKGDPDGAINISASIEKLRKQTEKIKESLSVRRKDRVNPNELKGKSIVDLAVAFDSTKKIKMQRKSLKLKEEQDKVKKDLEVFAGNRHDIDGVRKEDNDI